MKLINRSSFTLLAKAPFADWVATLDGKLDEQAGYELLTLAQLRESGSVYLIDEVAQEEDFTTTVQKNWQSMLENELAAWDEFGDYWPDISQDTFYSWFEIQTNVMTFDLSQASIMTATME